MFEVVVTWSESDERPSTYLFKTIEEVNAFRSGLSEVQRKLASCPRIRDVKEIKVAKNIKDLDLLHKAFSQSFIFSIFVGVWSVTLCWLFTFFVLVECTLIGILSAILCYVVLILLNLSRQRSTLIR